MRNNLFWRGRLNVADYTGTGSWTVKDNLFDHVTLTGEAVPNSHNGYVATGVLPGSGSGNVTVPSPADYVSGTLGGYYYPTSGGRLSLLINAGSRTAAQAGLFHYTVKVTNEKDGDETPPTVDIGYHYVACANGVPVDTDGEGLADYFEDWNGDGVRQATESDTAQSDTDYDGVSDGLEVAEGTDPADQSRFLPRRLAYWRFNGANWKRGEEGQEPIAEQGVAAEPSFHGTALRLTGQGSYLKYRDVELSHAANLNLARGTMRFWFKSDWTLAAAPDWANMIDVGNPSAGWWSMYFQKTGGQVRPRLASQAAQGQQSAVRQDAPLDADCHGPPFMQQDIAMHWATDKWRLLTVTWAPTWAVTNLGWFYLTGYDLLDDEPVAYPYLQPALFHGGDCHPDCPPGTYWHYYGGRGVPPDQIPGSSVCSAGFSIGSDAVGQNQLQGLIDELEFFNYPIGTVESRRGDDAVTITLLSAPSPKVRFSRLDQPNPVGLTWKWLNRRVQGQGPQDWVSIANQPWGQQVEDANVTANVVYEYSFGLNGPPDTTVGIDLAPVHRRGKVILLVESSLLAPLAAEIELLRTNLVGDGWSVTQPLSVPRHHPREDIFTYRDDNWANRVIIEQTISQAYDPSVPNVIFIVGHATIPYSGRWAHDGHQGLPGTGPCHGGPWVADGYYGVLNKGLWQDSEDYPPAQNCLWAVPGDECFDNDWLPALDMAVGRIDFSRM
ncbi:MAG: hypothetical protein FJ387_27690, partial [Verrucomicrobia bacterium]|nr:hypothetical protein [Verrucomicrobiota bacterium]